MVYEHVQIGGGARCYEEEHKRHPEARKNSFKALQAFASGQKRLPKANQAQGYGAWGPIFKNKENFVNMHMF